MISLPADATRLVGPFHQELGDTVIAGLVDSSNGEAPAPAHRFSGSWGNPGCHAPNHIGALRTQGSPCAAKKGGIDKTMPESGVGVEPKMWGRSSNSVFLQKQF